MRRFAWLLLLLVACAPPREVEVLSPRRGELVESFSEEARTRLGRTYPVRMPLTGRIGRIDLEPGDRVRRGQVLVSFDRIPGQSDVEQATARLHQAEARLAAGQDVGVEQASLEQARARLASQHQGIAGLEAELSSLRTRFEQARRESRRNQQLFEQGWISSQDAERARVEANAAQQSVRQASSRLAQARRELDTAAQAIRVEEETLSRRTRDTPALAAEVAGARAELEKARHESGQQQVVSPIDGVVLERNEQGPAQLSGGTQLLLLGNLKDLEAVSEVLTEDSLRLESGTLVELESAPGKSLRGKVDHIEPAGFTKLSSLGVEQQRVNVILRFTEPAGHLGAGYRLRARFLIARQEKALTVPRYTVLQHANGSYAVLKVVGDVLRWQKVKLGMRGETELEVLEGVSEGDALVALPEATLPEGEKVKTLPYQGR